ERERALLLEANVFGRGGLKPRLELRLEARIRLARERLDLREHCRRIGTVELRERLGRPVGVLPRGRIPEGNEREVQPEQRVALLLVERITAAERRRFHRRARVERSSPQLLHRLVRELL